MSLYNSLITKLRVCDGTYVCDVGEYMGERYRQVACDVACDESSPSQHISAMTVGSCTILGNLQHWENVPKIGRRGRMYLQSSSSLNVLSCYYCWCWHSTWGAYSMQLFRLSFCGFVPLLCSWSLYRTAIIYAQDACLVDVYYDIRGTIERYVRSCQQLSQCTHLTTAACTDDKCCSQLPDRCLCRPGICLIVILYMWVTEYL